MLTLEHNGSTLEIPGSFGEPGIKFNGRVIPSARIWDLAAYHMVRGERTPREKLFTVARNSEVFRWEQTEMLVHTLTPRKTDQHIFGAVFARHERQRVRPLVSKFDVRIAKVDGEITTDAVDELHYVAKRLGREPVGMNDGRIYYAKDPQTVFDAFGTKDWVRIAVYLKRPGGSSVPINFGV